MPNLKSNPFSYAYEPKSLSTIVAHRILSIFYILTHQAIITFEDLFAVLEWEECLHTAKIVYVCSMHICFCDFTWPPGNKIIRNKITLESPILNSDSSLKSIFKQIPKLWHPCCYKCNISNSINEIYVSTNTELYQKILIRVSPCTIPLSKYDYSTIKTILLACLAFLRCRVDFVYNCGCVTENSEQYIWGSYNRKFEWNGLCVYMYMICPECGNILPFASCYKRNVFKTRKFMNIDKIYF